MVGPAALVSLLLAAVQDGVLGLALALGPPPHLAGGRVWSVPGGERGGGLNTGISHKGLFVLVLVRASQCVFG